MRLIRFLEYSAMRLLAAQFHSDLAIAYLHQMRRKSCCFSTRTGSNQQQSLDCYLATGDRNATLR